MAEKPQEIVARRVTESDRDNECKRERARERVRESAREPEGRGETRGMREKLGERNRRSGRGEEPLSVEETGKYTKLTERHRERGKENHAPPTQSARIYHTYGKSAKDP